MNKLNIEMKYQITYGLTMKFRLFRILTIILSFFFLTGFVPILSFVGPGVTVLTTGNVYKAAAQLVIDQSIQKKTGKSSLTLVKDELSKNNKNYKENKYGHQVIIKDDNGNEVARVVYAPDKPLSCGAKCYIETHLNVEVIE